MSFKVLVTPRSFGKTDHLPVTMLEEAECEITMNTLNRPFTEDELMLLVEEIDGIIIGVDPLTTNVLKKARRLKAISKYGVGLNNIDLKAAAERGIMVTYTPGTNSSAVAELAIGLMLDVARNISAADRVIRRGKFGESYNGLELWGKTLGILGTGQIGKQLALRAKGFNMKILCYDLVPDQDWADKSGAFYMSLNDLLQQSDIISCHLPLTEFTRHLISTKELSMVKPNAIIINTARGGIIDENALYDALVNNRIMGAGLDVFESEPIQDSPLINLDNVVHTPHIGAHTKESIEAMGKLATQNLIFALTGKTPQFTVKLEQTGIGSASK